LVLVVLAVLYQLKGPVVLDQHSLQYLQQVAAEVAVSQARLEMVPVVDRAEVVQLMQDQVQQALVTHQALHPVKVITVAQA
jgi:hypothetical protein